MWTFRAYWYCYNEPPFDFRGELACAIRSIRLEVLLLPSLWGWIHLRRLLLRSSFSNGGTSVSKHDFHLYEVLTNYLTDCMVLRSEQNHKRMVVLKNTMYECSETQASESKLKREPFCRRQGPVRSSWGAKLSGCLARLLHWRLSHFLATCSAPRHCGLQAAHVGAQSGTSCCP